LLVDFGQCKRFQFTSDIAEYPRILAHKLQNAADLQLVLMRSKAIGGRALDDDLRPLQQLFCRLGNLGTR